MNQNTVQTQQQQEDTKQSCSFCVCCCMCSGMVFIISGGLMYLLCLDAVERNVCGENEQIEKVGLILFYIGVGIYSLYVVFCLLMCLCCFVLSVFRDV